MDKKTGKPIVLSVEEKERVFVDALQAYFFDGRQVRDTREFGAKDGEQNGSCATSGNTQFVLGCTLLKLV